MKRKTAMIFLCTFFLAILLSGCIADNSGNENTGNNSTVMHAVGSGSDDFWITYPLGNPSDGQNVSHLSWILDSLEKNCVVFVVHKTGCYGCKAQADRVIRLAEKYQDSIEFYDLDIPLGGDIAEKAYEVFFYDPNGPPGYIALTGVFTRVEHNGEVEVGWHSWEGDVADSIMEEWIKDGIHYYQINSG
jgi:hypothetical protein